MIEEKISSKQLLRNDLVFGTLQMMSMRLQIRKDKHKMREAYDEGLKHLINIYEVNKTPITHY